MTATTIEWTEETWNPTVGCSRVSPGCGACYAVSVAHRAMQPAHEGLTIKRPGEGRRPRARRAHVGRDAGEGRMIRLEVTEGRPLRTTVAYIDTAVLPALVERLRPVVDQAVAEVADRHRIRSDAAALLAGELAQLRAEDEAYERVCARRWVLAL